MAFGAGHIMDMLNRMKQNRAIIPSKRARFKEDVREGIYSKTHRIRRILDREDLTPEEKQRVIQRIRLRAARSRRRDIAIYLIASLITLVSVLVIFRLFN